MESAERQFSLSPARFIFLAFINVLLSLGIVLVPFLMGIEDPSIWILAGVCAFLLLSLGVVALLYRTFHAQAVLCIRPDRLRVNFTGLGRLVDIPWENVLYAKIYALSVDQQGLGIALKNPEQWINRLSVVEKALPFTFN